MSSPEMQKALDDLRVVRAMIERTRKATMESSFLFVWWGFLSLVAISINYYFHKLGWFHQIGLLWALFLVAGYLGTFLYLRKKRRNGVVSFLERMIGMTWFACGITVIILSFIAPPAGAYDWSYVPAMVTVVLALGVFITGFLYEWRFLIFTAFLWWTGAVVMLVFEEASLLIMGFLVGGLMIALGFVARARHRHEQIASASSS